MLSLRNCSFDGRGLSELLSLRRVKRLEIYSPGLGDFDNQSTRKWYGVLQEMQHYIDAISRTSAQHLTSLSFEVRLMTTGKALHMEELQRLTHLRTSDIVLFGSGICARLSDGDVEAIAQTVLPPKLETLYIDVTPEPAPLLSLSAILSKVLNQREQLISKLWKITFNFRRDFNFPQDEGFFPLMRKTCQKACIEVVYHYLRVRLPLVHLGAPVAELQ